MDPVNAVYGMTEFGAGSGWADGAARPLLLLTVVATLALAAAYLGLRLRRSGSNEAHSTRRIVAPLPTYRRSIPLLASELARVRRYQRPLAVVVLKPAADELSGSHGGNGQSHGNGNGNGNGNG